MQCWAMWNPATSRVLAQGFPQLVRISPEFVKLDAARAFAAGSPVACQVHLLDESPLVPDLDRLEAMVAAETEDLSDDAQG